MKRTGGKWKLAEFPENVDIQKFSKLADPEAIDKYLTAQQEKDAKYSESISPKEIEAVKRKFIGRK